MTRDNKKLEVEKLRAEVERLKKELKKKKKYGLVWEDKPEDVVEQCKKQLPVLKEIKNKEINTDKEKPVNLLIEGDNYHALSVLNYTHTKKVDVIYIDPPYNTGKKTWRYNNDYVDKEDAFFHSKWVSFINKRLVLAKSLLTNDGILMCAIDSSEQEALGLLLQYLFPNKEIVCVTVIHNHQGIQGKNFSYIHEYLYFVIPYGKRYIANVSKDIFYTNLRDDSGTSFLRTNAKNCFYPIFIKRNKIVGFGNVPDDSFHPKDRMIEKNDGTIELWPLRDGIERKWRYARQSVESIWDSLEIKKTKRGIDIFQKKEEGSCKTVWDDKKFHAGRYGTSLVAEILGKKEEFPFPKSIHNLIFALDLVSRNRKNAIILDFFAGSGTTGHAVLELNKKDGGNRQFILATNNENNICTDVCYPRIKKVITGYKDSKGQKADRLDGNLKYFKTDFVDYEEPTDRNKIKLTEQVTEMLCVKEGTFEKVLDQKKFKIFKNSNHYTGIIFDQIAIPAFKRAIKDIKGKFSIYIFSLGDETFDEEFADIKQKVKLSPIPEAILRVYRRIFK